jgi:hypothetical protein
MNSPAKDIADILVTQGIATAIGTDIFCFELPLAPDACITVLDAPGFPPNPHYSYEMVGVQALVRGKRNEYEIAYALAESVKAELNGKTNYAVDSAVNIVLIKASTDILPLGNDEHKRPVLSLNFEIHRQET